MITIGSKDKNSLTYFHIDIAINNKKLISSTKLHWIEFYYNRSLVFSKLPSFLF